MNTYLSGRKVSTAQLTPNMIAQYVKTESHLIYCPISSEWVFLNILTDL